MTTVCPLRTPPRFNVAVRVTDVRPVVYATLSDLRTVPSITMPITTDCKAALSDASMERLSDSRTLTESVFDGEPSTPSTESDTVGTTRSPPADVRPSLPHAASAAVSAATDSAPGTARRMRYIIRGDIEGVSRSWFSGRRQGAEPPPPRR